MNQNQLFTTQGTGNYVYGATQAMNPQVTPSVQQSWPRQQNPNPFQSTQPAYLPGRLIQGEQDIKPNDVPMDGNPAFFPEQGYNYILAKAWNQNGGITTVKYVPEQPQVVADPVGPTEFERTMLERMDRIEKLLAPFADEGGSDNA